MKFIHLSDLHIGKRVCEYSMHEDQEYILTEILGIIDSEKPDAVLIAGDVYDKSQPSAEAVSMLDDFIYDLSRRNIQLFIISGNHDSPERLSFGGRIFRSSGIHISPVYNGKVEPVTLKDGYGDVNVYLLPFVKPATVRPFFEDTEIASYTDAVRTAVGQMNIDTGKRNVLLTHQFVTGAERCESEEISVGGSDNVDASVFEDFDYVALGHIHGPQNIGSEKIRYCGTPLKYSVSEISHKKSVTVVELGAKGDLNVKTVPLVPKHDLVEIKGRYDELMKRSFYEGTTLTSDYVHVVLTDENDVINAQSKLHLVYRNMLKLTIDNQRTRNSSVLTAIADAEHKSPLELFAEFYREQNGTELTEEQRNYTEKLIEKIWEDEK